MLEVIQTCDGCGAQRHFPVPKSSQARNIMERAEGGGWKDVGGPEDNVHLCLKCIKKALKGNDSQN